MENRSFSHEYHFTFLHGIRVRSGTNYISKIMECHPLIQLVPPAKTTDEFPLLRGLDLWENAFNDFVTRYNGDKSIFSFSEFAEYLGTAWLKYIIDVFALKPGHIFLKDPSVRHINSFFHLFPRAKLIILVRDGRDNVASSIKAGLAIRKNLTISGKIKRQLNHLMLRDLVGHARDWATAAQILVEFDARFRTTAMASHYIIVRYEDAFRDPRGLAERIFRFMGLEINDGILAAVENVDVVGSSFYSPNRLENAHKPNWIPTPKTEAFRPVGRWKQWGRLRRWLFKRFAGRELIALGYEKDMRW